MSEVVRGRGGEGTCTAGLLDGSDGSHDSRKHVSCDDSVFGRPVHKICTGCCEVLDCSGHRLRPPAYFVLLLPRTAPKFDNSCERAKCLLAKTKRSWVILRKYRGNVPGWLGTCTGHSVKLRPTD